MRRLCFLLLGLLALRAASAADADAWKSQIIYFVVTDRFSPPPGVQPASACKLADWNSGTWSGVTDKLDYMQDLGMTAVWITPIPYQYQGNFFGFTGYAGYWTEDWTRLEPHFGTEQDLMQFLNATQSKGMLTMLDVVANHVGPVGTNYSAVVPFNSSEHYHGCDGCDPDCNIPQTAYDSNDLLAIETCRLAGLTDLNQSVPFVKQQLLSWLNTTLAKYPFDAIRIDTVKHVALPFWRDYTAALPAAGSNTSRNSSEPKRLFSIGEVMHGDTNVIAKYITGPQPAMDAVLNFPLYYQFVNVFQKKQDMRQLLEERQKQAEVLGPELVSRLGVFIDNHDVNRFSSQQPDRELLKNALAFALLTEGIPIVYYGTEQGFNGSAAGDANRECMWEFGYDTKGELFTLIRTLAGLRTNRTLWNTTQTDLNVTSDCFIFSRGPDVLVVTTNTGSGSSGNNSAADEEGKPPVFKLQGASSSRSCVVWLPESITLLDKGVAAVTDVLQPDEVSATGLTWDPDSRTLTVQTPQGAPRVLSSTRFLVGNLTSHSNSTDAAAKAHQAAGKQSQSDWNGPVPASSSSSQVQLATSMVMQLLTLLAMVVVAVL